MFQTNAVPENAVVYERRAPGAGVVVAVNFGRETQAVPVALASTGSWANVLETNQPAISGPTNLVVELQPGGAVVLSSGN